LSRHEEVSEIYRRMTVNYPELPEPWNNLGTEYFRLGQYERAREALQMALMANPNYTVAQENLGEVQLRLAQQAFERARGTQEPDATKDAQPSDQSTGDQPSP